MNREGQPLRVLVADRHPDVAGNTGRLLEAGGFEVQTACDRGAALAAAASFLPHALVIDLGFDGWDTAEIVSALADLLQPAGVYVVTIADAGAYQLPFMRQLPVDARLVKPAAYRMLLGVLRRRFAHLP